MEALNRLNGGRQLKLYLIQLMKISQDITHILCPQTEVVLPMELSGRHL